MKSAFLVILTTLLLCLPFSGFSQITTDTITITKDAFVYNNEMNSNYGDSSLLYVYSEDASSGVYRTFIEVDLSSIPVNAIILSAKLRLTVDTYDNSPTHDFYAERATASWTESGITWRNQPGVETSDQISIAHADVSSGTYNYLDLTDHVQFMVNYPNDNYGWRIRLESEAETTGNFYYSSDQGENDPEIEIKYILPIEISGYVTHCTNGNSDGAIEANVSEGTGTYDYYEWFKFTAGNTESIESGTNISNADVRGLGPGLYLLHVEDDSGYTNYQYFLVGEEGEETVVSMYANNSDTSAMYWEDAWIRDEMPDLNQGDFSYKYLYADANVNYTRNDLEKFQLDFDYLLDVNAADLYLYSGPTGYNHYRTASSSNKSYVDLITSDWNEQIVTWNTKPTVSSSIRDSIPQTTSTGFVNRNDTINMIPFVEYWQQNPEQNFGVQYSISTFPPSTWSRLCYGSSDHTTFAYRPKFEISFEVKESVITNFVDSLGLGSIAVNSPNGETPYTYLISTDSLPPLDSIWNVFKDSIEIDSSTFWNGRTNDRNFTYANLVADTYFIGIYDNTGNLIFNEEVVLSPSIEIYDSTDIDVDNDTLKVQSPASSAEATLFLSLPEDDDGGFIIEIVSLADDIQIGFNNESDPFPAQNEDYEFSLDVRTSGKVYFMMTDSIIDSTTVSLNDELKLLKDNGSVYAYKNGTSFASASIELEAKKAWKVDAELKGAGAALLVTSIIGQLLPPKIPYEVNDPTCSSNQGSITLNSTGFSFFSLEISAYTIKDESGATVASASGTIALPTTIDLSVGIYTIHCTYSAGFLSGTMFEQFVVGYPVNWNITSGLTSTADPLQIIPTVSTTTGYATSGNTTISSFANWMAFRSPPAFSTNYSISSNIFEFENSSAEYPIKVLVYHPGGSVLSRWVVVLDENDAVQDFFVVNNDRVYKVELTDVGGTVTSSKLYYDGNLESDLTTSVAGDLNIDLTQYGIMPLNDSKVNFCATRNTYVAKTKPFTDGSYYTAISGEVDFQYTGEYHQSDLIYELTDIDGNVISTGNYSLDVTGSTGINKKNADNRYTIDIGGQSAGFYLLTITNVKGEQHYLRIKI